MDLSLSFGKCRLEEPLSSDVDRLMFREAVVMQEYRERIAKTHNKEFKSRLEDELANSLLDFMYKRQAMYISEYDFDLGEYDSLWVFLRDNCRPSDRSRLNSAIEELDGNMGNEAEDSVMETQFTSLPKPSFSKSIRSSVGRDLKC